MTKKDKSWFILMMIYLMELLNELVEKGMLEEKGVTKGKRCRKK